MEIDNDDNDLTCARAGGKIRRHALVQTPSYYYNYNYSAYKLALQSVLIIWGKRISGQLDGTITADNAESLLMEEVGVRNEIPIFLYFFLFHRILMSGSSFLYFPFNNRWRSVWRTPLSIFFCLGRWGW